MTMPNDVIMAAKRGGGGSDASLRETSTGGASQIFVGWGFLCYLARVPKGYVK